MAVATVAAVALAAAAAAGATAAATAAEGDARAALYANTCYTKLTLDDVKRIWALYPSDLNPKPPGGYARAPTARAELKPLPGSLARALRRVAQRNAADEAAATAAASADANANAVDDEYASLGTPVSLTPLSGGLSNSNYKIVTTAPAGSTRAVVLLKVCDEKTADELEGLVDVSLVLKTHAFDTCYPLRKADGTFVTLYTQPNATAAAAAAGDAKADTSASASASAPAKTHRVLLFEFLRGANPKAANSAVMSALGSAMARLHSIPLAPHPELARLPGFPMGYVQMLPFLESAEVKAADAPLHAHEFVALLREQCTSSSPHALPALLALDVPHGILHGDVFLENTMFRGDNEMVALIDFEETCAGHAVLDVAMTLVGCAYSVATNTLDLALARAYLTAYHAVRPLTALEQRTFARWLAYALLSIAFWRFRQFVVRFPDPKRADAWKPIVDRYRNIPVQQLDAIFAQPPFTAAANATSATATEVAAAGAAKK